MNIYAPAVYDPEQPVKAKSQLLPKCVVDDIYEGLGVDVGLLYSVPVDDNDLECNYLISKLWRMNNLYSIIDKDGERIPFVMNHAQHVCYAAALRWYRVLILKSRQQGISTFWLLCFQDDAIFYSDLSIGLMSQGKRESSKLLKRVKLAWKTLDPEVKRCLANIDIVVNKSEEIGFSNGSSIYIAVSFRSDSLHRLHVSELGKISNNFPERAKELKTGTLQAIKPGNPVIIESTAEGDNMFKEMWDTASNAVTLGSKDFVGLFLSWVYDEDCNSYIEEVVDIGTEKYFGGVEEELGVKLTKSQKNFWVMQRRELGDYIYQEYPSIPAEAFIGVRDGTYYARLYVKHVILGKREIKGLYDPRLSVQVSMDLGMNDTFVLVFFQKYGKEIRIIDEYWNSGYEIKHYIDIIFEKPYVISNVEVPHDSNVRELQTGKTRVAHMRSLGVNNLHRCSKDSREDGIDAVRKMIPHLWIDTKCVYLIKCLKTYTKEYDETHEVWKNRPAHTEASNGADAIRYIPMGLYKDSIKVETVNPYQNKEKNTDVTDGLSI